MWLAGRSASNHLFDRSRKQGWKWLCFTARKPDLHVECSKGLSDTKRHPLGTVFRIKAKLTDREGGREFLYSYWGWDYEVVSRPHQAR